MPENDDYPKDLWTARRAEYVTMAKKMPQREKEKKGCRDLFIILAIGILGGFMVLANVFS